MKKFNAVGLTVFFLFLTLSATPAAAGSISGTVSCPAYTGGPIYVAAYDSPDPATANLLGDGVYQIADLGANNTYLLNGIPSDPPGTSAFIFAFWDEDGNANAGDPEPDVGDFIGAPFMNPLWVSTQQPDLTDVNFGLAVQRGTGFSISGALTSSMTVNTNGGAISVMVFDGADFASANVLAMTQIWPDPFPTTYTINGMAGNTGDTVYVFAYWDANGDWQPGPGPGDYFGVYAGNGLLLSATPHTDIDVPLDSVMPGATLQGTVSSDGGSQQIGGIGVSVYTEKCNWDTNVGNTTTNPDGSYTLPNLPPGEVYVRFSPDWNHKNFLGGFFTGGGPVSNDCGAAVSFGLTAGVATTLDADLEPGPNPFWWFEPGVYNGTLEFDFAIQPAFRHAVVSATVATPNRGFHTYDLDADRFNKWDTPCRFMDMWTKNLGGSVVAEDYGTYTLTVNFDGGFQEVRTYNFDPPTNAPIGVVDGSIAVTVLSDGSAQVDWNQDPGALGLGQRYQVRVREVDTNKEVFRSSSQTAAAGQAMSRTLSAGDLQCLEIGRDYKWLVRAFSADEHHSVTKYVSPVAYAPTTLEDRTTTLNPDGSVKDRARVFAWKGGLLFVLPVRYGSIDTVTAARVTRPDESFYDFDLAADWYDGATEAKLFLRNWSHWEPAPVAGGTYSFSVSYNDGHVENFDRTLPDPIPQFQPVDIATMGAQVHPDGAITFKWDVPVGSEGNMFQVRVRDHSGKEYFKSKLQQPGENQTTAWPYDVRAMVPGQYYTWFVRQWDPTFQVMMESQRFDFFYDPWGFSGQRPPESDGYALPPGQFLYVANEGTMGDGVEIVQIDSNGSAKIVGFGFRGASGLAIQPGTGHLFVSDDRGGIYVVQPDGTINQVLNTVPFSNPNALAFDASGRLLVAEAGDRISRVDPTNAATYEVLAQGFNIPQGVGAVGDDVYFTDNNGFIYLIPDTETVFPKTPGDVMKYTGHPEVMGSQGGLVIDAGGNVIAADSNGKIILVFAGDGSVNTVLDMPGKMFRGLSYSPDTNTLFASVFNDHEIYEIPLWVWPPEPQVFAGASQNKLFGPFGSVISSTDFAPFVSPLYADTDNDGVADPEDAFPNDPAASVDSDGDGMPDDWHPGMNETDSTSVPPLVLDDNDDDDTHLDVSDNCPATENDDQADWNGDGLGDACDPNIWQMGISGQITSTAWTPGGGDIYIVAFNGSDLNNAETWGMGQFSDSVPFNHTTYLWNGGPGNQVWGFAFWDANGNADPNNPSPDAGDFIGEFASNPINLANPGVAGVDIVIDEPFNPAAYAFIEGNVMNVNTTAGLSTFFMADIYEYDGTLPDDIQAVTISGPGVNMTWNADEIANQKDGLEFYPEWNEFFVSVPGLPQVGIYTFTVTINGIPLVYKDIQHINRTLPVPTGVTTNVVSKTPMFTWDDISGIPGATAAFRFQVKDTNGTYLISTPRTNGMTSYTIPEGKLTAGGSYLYRVRVSDSEQWLDVQNRAQTDWTPFTLSGTPDHAAPPVIEPDEWNAAIWNQGEAMCWVEITDLDGVASDGSSHQVTVTPPGGSAVPLDFAERTGPTAGNYSVFLEGPPQSGDYVIRVTDPNGLTDMLIDNVEVTGMVPPKEADLMPSLRNPYAVSLDATFDNIVAEGPGPVTLTEDFSGYPDNSEPDPARFNWWGNGNVNVSGNALQLSSLPVVGRGDVTVSLKDAGAYNSLQADVTVNAASSGGAPRARLSGAWFNLDGSDVYASLSLKKNGVVFSVSQDMQDETYHWNTLASGVLKAASLGETVTLKIEWTGTDLIFTADQASFTYTPPVGSVILPARYPDRNLQVRLNLITSVTPKFAWNQIAGANRYRVRIYSFDGARTLHKGWVDDGAITSYVVPPGVLRPNGYYQYRIEAWDVAGATVDNFSKTDKFRFYTGMPGDVNTNGFVDLADAVSAFQITSGQPAPSWASRIGDVNADGVIDTTDAAFIIQKVGGFRDNP